MISVLETLWKMSWQSAILAGAVWVVCRCARKAPASWRCALWLLVTIKFFVPPFALLPSQIAIGQRTEPIASATVARENVAQPRAIAASPQAGAASPREAFPTSPERAAVLSVNEAVILLWLAGVIAMSIVLARRYAGQRRLLGDSVCAGDQLGCMLCGCAKRLGVRWVPEVRLSDAVRTPMLIGAIRPVILLPVGIIDSCDDGDLRAMLLHELAHVKRRDIAVMWLGQLAQVLFFFNPAVWLAGREMRRERELACDEMVLSRAAIAPREYASGYISALKLANARPVVATSLAMAEPFEVEKARLDRILQAAVPRLSPAWAVALAVAVIIGLPTFSGCGKCPATTPASSPYISLLVGDKPMRGPGAVVTLGGDTLGESGKLSYYLLSETINELWAAGAKAISVDGQRITGSTWVGYSQGSAVTVNGDPITQPTIIKAIGPLKVRKQSTLESLQDGSLQIVTRHSVEVPARELPAGTSEQALEMMAGVTDVNGPGVSFTIYQKPKRPIKYQPDIFYSFDIYGIVNDLWRAGATAVSVNDHRWVTGTSVTYKAGTTYPAYLDSRPLAWPLIIKAIGDPNALGRALRQHGGQAERLMGYNQAEIEQQPHVLVPAYAGPRSPSPSVGSSKPGQVALDETKHDKMLLRFPHPLKWTRNGVTVSIVGIGRRDPDTSYRAKSSLVVFAAVDSPSSQWSLWNASVFAKNRELWTNGRVPSREGTRKGMHYYVDLPSRGTAEIDTLTGDVALPSPSEQRTIGPLTAEAAGKALDVPGGVMRVGAWRVNDIPSHYADPMSEIVSPPKGGERASYLTLSTYAIVPTGRKGSPLVTLIAYGRDHRVVELQSRTAVYWPTDVLVGRLAPYFGFRVDDYLAKVGKQTGRPIIAVDPDGPAHKAGIRPGDIIIQIGEHKMDSGNLFGPDLKPQKVTIVRDGRKLDLTITPVRDPIWAELERGISKPWRPLEQAYTGGKDRQYVTSLFVSNEPVPPDFVPVSFEFHISTQGLIAKTMPFKFTHIPLPKDLWN